MIRYNFPLTKPTRPFERLLLFFVTLILAAGVYLLKNAGLPAPADDAVQAAIIIGSSFWFIHIILAVKGEKGDEVLFPLAAFLIVIGWLEIYRLDPDIAFRQTFWIMVGGAAFVAWIFLVKDYRVLEDYKYVFLVIAVILQISVAIFGQEINGAKLWFKFRLFSIQPVEIVRIMLTIFLVSYMKQNRDILEKPLTGKGSMALLKYYAPIFVLWGIAESLLILQKDLGMALLLFGVFMGLFYVVTKKTFITALGFLLFSGSSFFLYSAFSHLRVRINNWWNPWADADGGGYQIIQALFALANGGILGAGLGKGEPYYIPEVHTDYIFAAIAEEFGLIASIIIISVFLVMIQRMFKTALTSKEEFGSFLALGLGIMFATQVFIIIGGVVKLIPLTGITLPFISYGGSSLVSNFIILALFMQISGKIKAIESLKGAKVVTHELENPQAREGLA